MIDKIVENLRETITADTTPEGIVKKFGFAVNQPAQATAAAGEPASQKIEFRHEITKGIMEKVRRNIAKLDQAIGRQEQSKYMREDIEKAFEQWLYEIDKLLMAGRLILIWVEISALVRM